MSDGRPDAIGWVVAETSTDEDGCEHRVLASGLVYADRARAEAEAEYLDSLGLSRSSRVLCLTDRSGDGLRERLETLAANWEEDAERLRRRSPHLGTASAAHVHATLLAMLVCAHDLRVELAAEADR